MFEVYAFQLSISAYNSQVMSFHTVYIQKPSILTANVQVLSRPEQDTCELVIWIPDFFDIFLNIGKDSEVHLEVISTQKFLISTFIISKSYIST